MATQTETRVFDRRISLSEDIKLMAAERRVSVISYPDTDQTYPDRRMSMPQHPLPTYYIGSRILNAVRLFWAFTESDVKTFIVPNTTFGIFTALAGLGLVGARAPTFLEVAKQLPAVLWFNWYLTFVFALANQRSPESIQEDLINKPWRPLPSGKITPEQTRRTMIACIPPVLAMNYALGVWREGAFILILTFLYNDLRGSDEIIRDVIVAVAQGLFNLASLRIAIRIDGDGVVTERAYVWIMIMSGIILTTIQISDLKDQEGDRMRGRKTFPLMLGDTSSRWILACFLPFWSFVCEAFWRPNLLISVPPAAMGMYLAFRVLRLRDPRDDAKTWKLWCLWHSVIHLLPVVCHW